MGLRLGGAAWLYAADAIAARRTGRPIPGPPLRYYNRCISLGRRDGIIQFVTADDRATTLFVKGRLAAYYKELVCRGAGWGTVYPTVLPTHHRLGAIPDTPAAVAGEHLTGERPR